MGRLCIPASCTLGDCQSSMRRVWSKHIPNVRSLRLSKPCCQIACLPVKWVSHMNGFCRSRFVGRGSLISAIWCHLGLAFGISASETPGKDGLHVGNQTRLLPAVPLSPAIDSTILSTLHCGGAAIIRAWPPRMGLPVPPGPPARSTSTRTSPANWRQCPVCALTRSARR